MAARGVNKVILVGNVGQDPEVRYMPNGDAVANVSLATSESWKDKNSGEQQERTEWHRLVFYRRTAEIVAEYVRKGSKLYAEGRLRTRSWEQDGVKRYATEIVVDNMQMLGDAGQASQGAPQQRQGGSGGNAYRAARDGSKAPSGGRATDSQDYGAPMGGDMYDDDIPF